MFPEVLLAGALLSAGFADRHVGFVFVPGIKTGRAKARDHFNRYGLGRGLTPPKARARAGHLQRVGWRRSFGEYQPEGFLIADECEVRFCLTLIGN